MHNNKMNHYHASHESVASSAQDHDEDQEGWRGMGREEQQGELSCQSSIPMQLRTMLSLW